MREWQQVTGFQSPCAEYGEEKLSLDKKYLHNPPAMFILKAGATSPTLGINKNDHLIVDRSLKAVHGDLVIAVIENEFKTARLLLDKGKVLLLPFNIIIGDDEFNDNFIWGVISSLHRRMR